MNRDESFGRETVPLQFWPDDNIYCGVDLLKGGTWLAINKKGWFVVITNFKIIIPSPSCLPSSAADAPSRGTIPKLLLTQDVFDPQSWLNIIKSSGCKNFNVSFGSVHSNILYSYCSVDGRYEEIKISNENIFSMSNGKIGSNWPKEQKCKQLIKQLSSSASETEMHSDTIIEDIFTILKDKEWLSNDQSDYTSVPIFIEPRNVEGTMRGTVSSSIVLVDQENKAHFVERTWTTPKYTEESLTFQINYA